MAQGGKIFEKFCEKRLKNQSFSANICKAKPWVIGLFGYFHQ